MAEAFPFVPNRRSEPITVRRTFNTEIITSRDGTEQRRALRDQPRWEVEFALTVTKDCRRAFDRLMIRAQRQEWDLSAKAGIWPLMTVMLDAQIQADRVTPLGVVDAIISAEAKPGTITEDTGTVGTTYDGREVFLIKPDRGQTINMDAVQVRERVDPGYGTYADFHPVDYTQRLWSAFYTGCNSTRVEQIRAFTARMKGMRGEFFMPTFMDDLQLSAGSSSGTSTLLVSGDYDEDEVHQTIAVRLPDGSYLFSRITDWTPAGDDTLLTVDTAWSEDIPITARVSWLHLRRLASDIIQETWHWTTAAQITLPMLTLPYVVSE